MKIFGARTSKIWFKNESTTHARCMAQGAYREVELARVENLMFLNLNDLQIARIDG